MWWKRAGCSSRTGRRCSADVRTLTPRSVVTSTSHGRCRPRQNPAPSASVAGKAEAQRRISSSTSRPQRRSASMCGRRCLQPPTRARIIRPMHRFQQAAVFSLSEERPRRNKRAARSCVRSHDNLVPRRKHSARTRRAPVLPEFQYRRQLSIADWRLASCHSLGPFYKVYVLRAPDGAPGKQPAAALSVRRPAVKLCAM